jgi:hypothetical protein
MVWEKVLGIGFWVCILCLTFPNLGFYFSQMGIRSFPGIVMRINKIHTEMLRSNGLDCVDRDAFSNIWYRRQGYRQTRSSAVKADLTRLADTEVISNICAL